ncbi:hypothetical protein DL96DRAFT_1709682 [Flagelloscypha sp. PMI_526]|nr:hypothetical protein DL96DRAFT_1709682 [Flagelloscypha sp. PMI_526]
MAFGLVHKSERANALQDAVEQELVRREYTAEPDATMAEFITIMVINNKSADLLKPTLTAELDDVIGGHFDPTFTDWVFEQAQRIADGTAISTPAAIESAPAIVAETAPPAAQVKPPVAAADSSTRRPQNRQFNQALSQALPTAQKRTASARSPSPGHSNKIRRTDPPTGPRAMAGGPRDNGPRSLLDRVGGPARNNQNTAPDPMLAQMESMGATPEQAAMMSQMMANGAFPPGIAPGMDMGAMGGDDDEPNGHDGPNGKFNGTVKSANWPVQQRNNNNAFMNQALALSQVTKMDLPTAVVEVAVEDVAVAEIISLGHGAEQSPPAPIAAPTPVTSISPPSYEIPQRPQSPSLCKFGVRCTNAHCRWSHPSPVATPESGVVLSNEPCDNGKNCKDKDCIKSHVSPAVLNPQASQQPPPASHPSTIAQQPSSVPCRFGAACTRQGCTFSHPAKVATPTQPCRYGAGCTKATCQFQHPEGRVLPNSFHRGLSSSTPMVTIKPPEAGSMGASSQNKSVTFNSNKPDGLKAKLEKQMKELEVERSQLQAKLAGKS